MIHVWTTDDPAIADELFERAIDIRDAFGVSLEVACQRAELERDALDEMDAPSDWDAGNVTFDPYV